METKKVIIIMILVIVVLFAIFGTIMGFVLFKNNGSNSNKVKEAEKFYITLDDMYCNLKDSKKIIKIKTTIEIIDEKTYTTIQDRQFLIRDEINKIIRNKKEEDIQGREGQIALQTEIKNSLVKLFNDENIINVYFDDLIIQ
ncbi:flagellar basal body-associated FliL family protein [Anaerosalibacter sp. Marseille-P3206]|uniref:flagellar basal body-associated FliL family protein n=1 Tax=Anaerosalibacter sp. Marseille-P3206 TaxID=1871005 RepID=UPI000986B111|nr:flagellar basal body-associated FliL family protein [Anaerosalibacter sp. Marseille-P3206]